MDIRTPKIIFITYVFFKKIGPYKILRKFSTNSYELELPTGIGISPIFNVSDLYPYPTDDKESSTTNADSDEVNEKQWVKKMPVEH